MPDLQLLDDDSPLFRAVKNWGISTDEYLTLIIALTPHRQPNFYDAIFQEYLTKGGEFPEFGGVKSANSRSTLPTSETVLFLLKGIDINARLEIQEKILSVESLLLNERVLILEETKAGEPEMSGKLIVPKEFVEMFLLGREWAPRFSNEFPAQLLSTKMDWNDLIVANNARQELEILESWLAQEKTLWTDAVA